MSATLNTVDVAYDVDFLVPSQILIFTGLSFVSKLSIIERSDL